MLVLSATCQKAVIYKKNDNVYNLLRYFSESHNLPKEWKVEIIFYRNVRLSVFADIISDQIKLHITSRLNLRYYSPVFTSAGQLCN
jgi:hypothetical protein